MKIDKDFAVKVEGKIFTADEIKEINISGGWFTIDCMRTDATKFRIETRVEHVEIVPYIGEYAEQLAKSIKPDNAMCNCYKKCVRNGFDNFAGAGSFDLAMKRMKECREAREAIKELVREAMTEETVESILAKKAKLKIDPDVFARLIKKYNQDITRSGG